MTLPGSHRAGIKHGCVVGGCGEVGAGEGGVVITPCPFGSDGPEDNLGYELGKSLLGWLMIPSDPFFYRLLLLVVTFFIQKMIDY